MVLFEIPHMSASEFEAFLVIAKRHRVLAFEAGDVKVTFHALAMMPEENIGNPTELRSIAEPEKKPMTFAGFSEEQIFHG